ncbi:MAG: Lrp/AsnC family transcriptional regulator [Candidatus Micrarchaeota archaeon]
MLWEIDAKDRAILYYLDEDARRPISQLSKKVKLNREVVRYRIDRMIERGTVQKFLTYIPITQMGFLLTTFFMNFQDTSMNDEEELIKYVAEKPEVIWVASTNGRFDLGFSISARNMSELVTFIAEFKDRYRNFITDFQMANSVRDWRFPRSYLLEDDNENQKPYFDTLTPYENEIDPVDKKILAALGEDGRMRAVEIARRVGVSADAVADRINKMKKDKLILGITLLLNNNTIKRKTFKSFITFHNVKKVEAKFLNYCNEEKNIVHVKRMLGPWEYEVDLELESEDELRELHSKLKAQFAESVRSTSFVSIYRTHKFDMGGFLLG